MLLEEVTGVSIILEAWTELQTTKANFGDTFALGRQKYYFLTDCFPKSKWVT